MIRTITRVGIGYDAHRLVGNRLLILGGVRIPFQKGLLGHSDADVLLHAIGDAVLGTLGKGDLGRHFPDTDPSMKNISSRMILRLIADMIPQTHEISWIDAVIIAQRPKLVSFFPEMIRNIAGDLKIDPSIVNLKATTTEGMGFPGREEGIAAEAVVTMTVYE